MSRSPKYSAVSPKELRRLFDYDEGTGHLLWKDSLQPRRNGHVAGHRNARRAIYVVITAPDGQRYAFLAHILVWAWVYGSWPEGEIDHVNGDHQDNRLSNLRVCSHAENLRNQMKVFGSVPFKGVCRATRPKGRFEASIRVNRKAIYLGSHETAEDAARAYDAAATRYFGEFAKTNASLGLLA